MRRYEAVLLILIAAFWVWSALVRRRRRPFGALIGLASIAALVLHLAAEGYRWQMIPLYLTTVIVVTLAVWDLARPAPVERGRSLRGTAAVAVALLLVSAPPVLVPVPELPEPPGPYGVGTTTRVVVDTARDEAYGDATGPRRLVMQVWYPAEPPADARPAPWLDDLDSIGPVLATSFGFPGFALDHVALMETHSYPGAPVAPGGPWPVVVYSHGWTGFRSAGLPQLEALASEGFVVAAVDHTYGSVATAFPGGEVVRYDPEALPVWGSVPEEQYDEAAGQLVATFSADLRFVLDELERLNREPGWPLSGLLDTDHVGLFGHSTGGGAVVAVCASDERCTAGLGFDPWVEPVDPSLLAAGVARPFLAVRSETWLELDNESVLARLARVSPQMDMVGVLGADHQDFTMLPLFSPLARLFGKKGPIASERMMEIIGYLLVGFFDQHLNGGPALPPEPPFEEVCVGAC
jgi:predicted dienelactone hydrolase